MTSRLTVVPPCGRPETIITGGVSLVAAAIRRKALAIARRILGVCWI